MTTIDPIPLTTEEIPEAFALNPETVFRLRPKNEQEVENRFGIRAGSGIVGRPAESGMSVYYEGNIYNASNMRSLLSKENQAAGRMKQRYPTVARTYIGSLEEVTRFFEVSVWEQPNRDELWAAEQAVA